MVAIVGCALKYVNELDGEKSSTTTKAVVVFDHHVQFSPRILLLFFCFSETAGGGREQSYTVTTKFPKSRQHR